ncbi:MAG TPA: hypothetical protein VIL46_14015, partial [Gemmataceae bacterium]
MANSPRRRVRPHVELLEERDLPSGLFLETFEAPAAPELPPGWSQWSSLGTPAFATSAAKSAGGSQSALANGRSDLTARLWRDGAVPADTAVGATVLADSLIPLQVIARGRGLDTDRPTYYAAEVTRGLEVRLLRVVDGQATQLGFLRSRSWLSGKWVEVRLTPRGSDLRVQVVRTDTGEYLNSAGFWQSGPANALRVEDGVIAGAGLAGVNRAARYAGPVYFDDFSLGADDPAGRREDFDAAAQGQLPAGWQAWSDKGFGHFGASDELAASAPNSLAGSGNSATTARAWLGDAQPADVRLSASVFLGTLIPTQLLLRGRGLDSPAASYYAVTLTRGAAAELVRVVDGRSTVLGSVRTAGYFSQQWVRVTFEAEGAALRVGVQRLDTGEWLTPLGEWQAARTD